ncbi:MAG: tetratricopeptide repeat protein [Candidatus Sumerlaeales bacterium]|nr:tetratricopeptide repeat protein [Candidatus Sumerlaeales bacterium]
MRINRLSAVVFAAIVTLGFSGCMQKSPEQRLERVQTLLQQNDTLGARLECQDIIKKYPDAPETLSARFMLSSIYASEQQPDEAIAELKAVMAASSQKDQLGQMALQQIVGLEIQRGHADNALKLIDEVLDKGVKDDPGLKPGLLILKSSVLMADQQTSVARDLLQTVTAETTATDVKNMLADRIAETYLAEENYDGGKAFLRSEFDSTTNSERKLVLLSQIVEFASQSKNDAETMTALREMTDLYDSNAPDELDVRKRNAQLQILLKVYAYVGNYAGCEAILKSELKRAKSLEEVIDPSQLLFLTYLRQGKTSAGLELLDEMIAQYPTGPFAEPKTKLEAAIKSGQYKEDIVDTRTLTMSLKENPIVPTVLDISGDAIATTTPVVELAPVSDAPTTVAK